MNYTVACDQLRTTIAGIYRFGWAAQRVDFTEKRHGDAGGLELRVDIVLRGGQRMLRGLSRRLTNDMGVKDGGVIGADQADAYDYTRYLVLHSLFMEALHSTETRRASIVRVQEAHRQQLSDEESEALEASEMDNA